LKRLFTFLIIINLSIYSCGIENEKNLNNFVSDKQKFSIFLYEVNSIYDLFKERYGFSKISEEHKLIKDLLLDEIYNNDLDYIFDIVFPLPEFTVGYSPKLLVISPRDRIYREDELLLVHDLSLEEIESIESAVQEKIDYSSVVVSIGGVAAYPSIIKETNNYGNLFKSHAHEWLHQYLIFFPLGRAYFDDPKMKTVNETLANIYSERLLLSICSKDIRLKDKICDDNKLTSDFNYGSFIRNLRLEVDKLLESGKISESEELMESARMKLENEGYYIRKINQAWFAFNGTYADSPTSSSNIDLEIESFIESQESIGVAIKKLRKVKNFQEYEVLISQKK
tara:strand:- start:1708 stop:2724 length:1017 start_codon:yes stop_codon:yes gene_type:complete